MANVQNNSHTEGTGMGPELMEQKYVQEGTTNC
jgi:hypothetical protein